MKKKNSIILGAVLALSTLLVVAQEKGIGEKSWGGTDARMFPAAELKWVDGPPSLPSGAQMAVLYGDPAKQGPFTIRLKTPAGYKIPWHFHSTDERVTVISGTVQLAAGTGKRPEWRQLETGDYALLPAGLSHLAWTPTETVLQVDSEGPFQRTFVNPADDPLSKK